MNINLEKLLTSLHVRLQLDMGREPLRNHSYKPRIQKVQDVGAIPRHAKGTMGNLNAPFGAAILAGYCPALRSGIERG
jgi:hypothetical protein